MSSLELSVLAAARDEPKRTALVVDGRKVAYGALAADVRLAMIWLGNRGWLEKRVAPDDADDAPDDAGVTRVAFSADHRYETLVTLYALFELGWPAVPLHPRWTVDERRRFLDRCAPVVFLERPWSVADADAADDTAGDATRAPAAPTPVDDERALAVIATSGTGGAPKGAVLSRRAMVASARASAANLGWGDDDRWLLSLPLAHVGGLSILTRCLVARRAAVVESATRFDAVTVARTVDERRVTLLSLVPTTLRRLLELEPPWRPPRHLRAILVGGAAAPAALLAAAAERGLPVLATYGLTEAGSQVTCQPYVTADHVAGARVAAGCGPPLPGFEVVVDDDGAIRVRGDALFSGYLPAGEASPLDTDGFLRTGDRGRIDAAGNLHVLGRLDQLIISGGENVAPREVEEALEAHPGIAEACVFAIVDDEWGQAVAAALVAAGEPPDDADLRRHFVACLASFKRPRRVAYLDALPRTAAGKIARAAVARAARGLLRPLTRAVEDE